MPCALSRVLEQRPERHGGTFASCPGVRLCAVHNPVRLDTHDVVNVPRFNQLLLFLLAIDMPTPVLLVNIVFRS